MICIAALPGRQGETNGHLPMVIYGAYDPCVWGVCVFHMVQLNYSLSFRAEGSHNGVGPVRTKAARELDRVAPTASAWDKRKSHLSKEEEAR